MQGTCCRQVARRASLVLSPLAFNRLTARCIACPITRRDHDWSFHVPLPDSDEISGLVQTDQCAAPRGSSEDRVSYARLRHGCLKKHKPGSNHCSRFEWSCNRWLKSSFPTLTPYPSNEPRSGEFFGALLAVIALKIALPILVQ